MQTQQISVGNSPTLLFASRPYPRQILIHVATGSLYIGNSTVSDTTGFKIDNGQSIDMELDASTALYGYHSGGGTNTAFTMDTVSP